MFGFPLNTIKTYICAFCALVILLPGPVKAARSPAEIGCEAYVHVTKKSGQLSFRFFMACDEDLGPGKKYDVIFKVDHNNLTRSHLINVVRAYSNYSFSHRDHNGVRQTVAPLTVSRNTGMYTYHLIGDIKASDPNIVSLLPSIYSPSDVVYLGAAGHHAKTGSMSVPGNGHDHSFFLAGGGSGMSKKQCEKEVNDFFNNPKNKSFIKCVGGLNKSKINCSINGMFGAGYYVPEDKSITINANMLGAAMGLEAVLRHEAIHKKQDGEEGLEQRDNEDNQEFCVRFYQAELQAAKFGGMANTVKDICQSAAWSSQGVCENSDLSHLEGWCRECLNKPRTRFCSGIQPDDPCSIGADN